MTRLLRLMAAVALSSCDFSYDPAASTSYPEHQTNQGGRGANSDACTGGPVQHWAGDVHVTCDVYIVENGSLTIEAGTRVYVAKGKTIEVAGSLEVSGTEQYPVRIMSEQDGVWGPLWLSPTANSRLSLRNVVISGAGDTVPAERSKYLGASVILGNDRAPLHVENVLVEGSTGVGVVLRDGRFTADSRQLFVRHSGSYPLFVKAKSMGSVPSGEYIGNALDAILVESAWGSAFNVHTRITVDTVIKNLGVPWVIGTGESTSALLITASSPELAPMVDIEPGTELLFSRVKGAGLEQSFMTVDQTRVGDRYVPLGVLRAIGTSQEPIRFSSAERAPQPGDWVSIRLGVTDSRTRLDHVIIEYAGANSAVDSSCGFTSANHTDWDCDAAFQIVYPVGAGAPDHVPLTNSVIRASLGSGVCRAFENQPLDFASVNSIESVAWCNQTPVHLANGCQSSCE